MFETVAVVGLGLMGGSLALALKEAGAANKIVGVDRSPATCDAALAGRFVDVAGDDLESAREGDLIVLATPVRTIISQVPLLAGIANDGATIIDLGSTKRKIVGAMDRLPARLLAVGGHPMCGKERSGLEAAEASLYRDKLFVLTPTARSSDAAMNTARELAQAVGGRVLVMNAERHDRIVAAVSHLPFVVACNLMGVVDEWSKEQEGTWELAASGFRDTTRLAASDSEMMLDIMLTNGENIADMMRRFSRQFAALADLVYGADEAALRQVLESAAQKRRELGKRE